MHDAHATTKLPLNYQVKPVLLLQHVHGHCIIKVKCYRWTQSSRAITIPLLHANLEQFTWTTKQNKSPVTLTGITITSLAPHVNFCRYLIIQFLPSKDGKTQLCVCVCVCACVYAYANDLWPDLTSFAIPHPSLLADLSAYLGAQMVARVCVFYGSRMGGPWTNSAIYIYTGPKEETPGPAWNAHRGHTRTQNLH